MRAALTRWEEAQLALGMLDEGAAKAGLAGPIGARQIPATLKPSRTWRRLEWNWTPAHARRDWELRDLTVLAEGLLARSDWDATLLDLQSGKPLWTWDPGKGALQWLGLADGQLWFSIEAEQERPRQDEPAWAAPVWIRGRGPKRAYQLAKLDLKTGQGEVSPYLSAHLLECLSAESVLVRVDKQWEVRIPNKQLKPPVVLEETALEKLKFAGAASGVLLFEVGTGPAALNKGNPQWAAFDRWTGRELWHTAEPLEEILPAPAAQAYRQGTRSGSACGVLSPDLVFQSLAATLVCRELKTGKLRWSYVDPVMSVRVHDCSGWVTAAGPFEAGGRKIVCAVYPESGLAALDARDGKLLWRLQTRAAPQLPVAGKPGPALASAPLTGERPVLWFACGENLLALDLEAGRTVWSMPLRKQDARPGLPLSALLPPHVLGARALLLVARGKTNAVQSIRLEPRPAEVSEADGETWSLEALRKALTTSADLATPTRWIALGLANDPDGRARLKAWVLRNAATCTAWIAAQAAPYGDEEFERTLLPLLKRPDPSFQLEEALAALLLTAPGKQKTELEALRALARQRNPAPQFVRVEESQAAAAKLRDAEKAAARPAASPEEEF